MEAKIETTVITNVAYKVEVLVKDEAIHKYSPVEELSLSVCTLLQVLSRNALISNKNEILEDFQASARLLQKYHEKDMYYIPKNLDTPVWRNL